MHTLHSEACFTAARVGSRHAGRLQWAGLTHRLGRTGVSTDRVFLMIIKIDTMLTNI